jgi:hypothetical protein
METSKVELETLVSVLNKLEENGYITQFKATSNGLVSLSTGLVFQPSDVKVESFYRFEGESNPEDNAVLYAIKTYNGESGTLIDGYSNSGSAEVGEFMRKVNEIAKK